MVNEKLMELRVVTGKVRFNYVNLFVPQQSLEGYAPKFGLCVLIAKEDLLEAVKARLKRKNSWRVE